MTHKRAYRMVPVLFRIVRGRIKTSLATSREVERFGGGGHLTPPVAFIRKVRSTRLREVVGA